MTQRTPRAVAVNTEDRKVGLVPFEKVEQEKRVPLPVHGTWRGANEETLLRETFYRLRLGVGYFEDGYQPGHLQQFVGSRSQVAEPQRCSAGFRAGMCSDQCAEAGAIDHRDIFQVQDELLLALS